MGAANVIPGVSGGTIAFITGIYEKLINSIKAFDLTALKLLAKFKFKALFEHINFWFLLPLFLGIGASIFSLAKLLEFLFCNYEVLTMAFFFGLILASVYLVGKQVNKWNATAIIMLLLGLAIAIGVSFLKPASANDGFLWVFICGVVAISSMILPGLSGSYVLLLMGNYLLVMSAVSSINIKVLIPLALGCGVGLIAFSWILSYIFKKFKDGTIGLLTGFVLGSLAIIWPWKNTNYVSNANNEIVDKNGEVLSTSEVCLDGIVLGYERYLPTINAEILFPIVLIIIGAIAVIAIDKFGAAKPKKS